MDEAHDVSTYLSIIDRLGADGRFFRGQLSKYDTIKPSISRDGYLIHESDIFYESIKLKESDFNSLTTPLQKLSKLQHYGVPTRLIDVTIDPLIALYFAVENIDDSSDSMVYIYSNDSYGFEDEHTRILSLLPLVPNPSIDLLKIEYLTQFKEEVSSEKVSMCVSNPIFIEHCDELKVFNERLYCQKGTFFLCGNCINEDDSIGNELKSLDSINPVRRIKIPYEYKKQVKDELDSKYNVSKLTIYPELTSLADYIKNKYKSSNLSVDGAYSILDVHDTSHSAARRLSIDVVLNKQLDITSVYSIATEVMEKYKHNQDVIWIYIAKDGSDYAIKNWLLRGQWINSSLNPKFRPITYNVQKDGYYWEPGTSYSVTSDFFNDKFTDEKTLIVYFSDEFKKFKKIFDLLYDQFVVSKPTDLAHFFELLSENKDEIRAISRDDLGISRNNDLNTFLLTFDYAINPIDDIPYLFDNKHLNQNLLYNAIRSNFERSIKSIDDFEKGIPYWMNKLDLTDQEYNQILSQRKRSDNQITL